MVGPIDIKPTGAFLNGSPLLATSPVAWTLREGVSPVKKEFEVPNGTGIDNTPDIRALILKQADVHLGGATLKMETHNGDVQFDRLSVLTETAGPNPHFARLLVADRRWVWARRQIVRRYNKRRRVGFRNLSFNKAVRAIQPVEEDVWYAPFSLPNPDDPLNIWTAKEILEDLFFSPDALGFNADEPNGLLGIRPGEVTFENDAELSLMLLPVEELDIIDKGDMALQRVLNYFPSIGVFVDNTGHIIVYSKTSGREREMVIEASAEVVGQGHVEFITNDFTRPSHVNVYFMREVELRVDIREQDDSSGNTVDSSISNNEKELIAENVLACPDFELEIPTGRIDPATGSEVIRTATQGDWITFDEALAGWRRQATRSGSVLALLRIARIRQAMVSRNDLWGPLLLTGERDPDADWAARIGAIQQHFRRSYRIAKEWVDRTLLFRAYLVATIDPVRGTRAPALAFVDHSVYPNQRSFLATRLGTDRGRVREPLAFAVNVTSLPESGRLDDAAFAAPFDVVIADSDQGIIQLNPRIDPYRLEETIMPSKIEEETIPFENIEKGNRNPIAFNAVATETLPSLSKSHRGAVLITAVPGAPNDIRQLHRVRVRPQDVRDLLPSAQQQGLDNAFGPPMDVFIPGTVETARLKHDDDRVLDIKRLFGIEEGEPNLAGMVVNDTDQESIDPNDRSASLKSLALAAAARIYGDEADRFMGSKSGAFNKKIQPAGNLEEVEFQLNPEGMGLTILNLPESAPDLDIWALLPSATRALVLNEVKSNKT